MPGRAILLSSPGRPIGARRRAISGHFGWFFVLRKSSASSPRSQGTQRSHGAPSRLRHSSAPPPIKMLSKRLAGGPEGTIGASGMHNRPRPPGSPCGTPPELRRCAVTLIEDKVSVGASNSLIFSIRGIPKLSNSERMLGFGSPGIRVYPRPSADEPYPGQVLRMAEPQPPLS